MTAFRRFGVYVIPHGNLLAAGSAWLGWDCVARRRVEHPDIAALPCPPGALTAAPRRYGFHGTIKPPFRLADGMDAQALGDALAAFCAGRKPVSVPTLSLCRIGRFLAIAPEAPVPALSGLAAATVETLDPFRAPPTEAELSRRRKAGLSARQEALLRRWGYPFVMEEFRFHMTLTGPLAPAIRGPVQQALSGHFAEFLGKPMTVDGLALMGEDADGMFHMLYRHTLAG